ncbi:hypothetical protein [Pseudonocardia sp. GCM10023141]|uniref:hypothetical protein n=1 Tax=Pseudonocardia sp. GCM10023141 TaxID=3252653 RepID=UPI00360C3F90
MPSLGSSAIASDLLPNRFNPLSNHPSLLSVMLKTIGSGPTPIGCCAAAGDAVNAVIDVAPTAAITVTAANLRRLFPDPLGSGGAIPDMRFLS